MFGFFAISLTKQKFERTFEWCMKWNTSTLFWRHPNRVKQLQMILTQMLSRLIRLFSSNEIIHIWLVQCFTEMHVSSKRDLSVMCGFMLSDAMQPR